MNPDFRRAMPTTTQRGYGAEHKAERERWRPLVESGQVVCWRCHRLIPAGAPWDLGHDEVDRSKYRGPEHVKCNRGATARLRVRRPRASDLGIFVQGFHRRDW